MPAMDERDGRGVMDRERTDGRTDGRGEKTSVVEIRFDPPRNIRVDGRDGDARRRADATKSGRFDTPAAAARAAARRDASRRVASRRGTDAPPRSRGEVRATLGFREKKTPRRCRATRARDDAASDPRRRRRDASRPRGRRERSGGITSFVSRTGVLEAVLRREVVGLGAERLEALLPGRAPAPALEDVRAVVDEEPLEVRAARDVGLHHRGGAVARSGGAVGEAAVRVAKRAR